MTLMSEKVNKGCSQNCDEALQQQAGCPATVLIANEPATLHYAGRKLYLAQ